MPEARTFCFDIDGVIATLVPNNEYDRATPQRDIIEMINTLFDLGNTIILFTARGSLSGIDWTNLTRQQMDGWGVKYHNLIFGKPAADYYVDDKCLSLDQLREIISGLHTI
jgi:hypothetical protein